MGPIGYTYEAGHHCPKCAMSKYGQEDFYSMEMYVGGNDEEGNPIVPIFYTDEILEPINCYECGVRIAVGNRFGKEPAR